ncbi:uncharacterized protein LOC135812693 isoform X1 [Sycon ciliatum]|uniref:uncharacterized protein LOC135812693 isoform X1 n=1 Tax=Sycon ciliatum TaxID=27933 RepID=UPI0031F6FA9E
MGCCHGIRRRSAEQDVELERLGVSSQRANSHRYTNTILSGPAVCVMNPERQGSFEFWDGDDPATPERKDIIEELRHSIWCLDKSYARRRMLQKRKECRLSFSLQ